MSENENPSLSTSFIDERLPVKSKIAYGFAGMANATLSGIALGSAITFFYNIKLGLSADYISLAWIIFAFWNAINDPIFGILEERTHTKIGRRIPYLRFGAPIYAIVFIFCWYPFGNTQIALFWNLLLVLFLFDSVYTMIGLITYTLPAEMTLTQKGRANLSVYGTYLGAIGMLLAMVLPMILLTGDETQVLNPLFKPTMIVVGLVCGLIMFLSSFFLVENEYTQIEESLGFFQSIAEAFKNKPFLIFEAGNFPYIIAWTILTGMMTYYVQFVMHLTGMAASLPLLIVFAMVFLFTIPANILVKKIGLKKTYIYSLIFASVSFIVFFIFGKHETLAFVGLALIGIGFAPISLVSQPLMADIIDFDELRTGKRRETTYAGVNALIVKPAISVANALFMQIIKFSGFNKDLDNQSISAQNGILFAFSIVPLICLVLTIVPMIFYPLDGKWWHKKKIHLNEVHLQKEQDYIRKLEAEGKISESYSKLKIE
ncbi:MAG: MFS transporter [Promethearchaeota archaeon]